MRVLLKVFVHPTFHGAVYSKMVILRRKPHITNRPGTWCPPAVLIQRSSQSIPVVPQLRSAQLQLWLFVPQQESWALGCWLGKWSWMCVCWRCCSLGCPHLTAGQRLVSLLAGAHTHTAAVKLSRRITLQSSRLMWQEGAASSSAEHTVGTKQALHSAHCSPRCSRPARAWEFFNFSNSSSPMRQCWVLHTWFQHILKSPLAFFFFFFGISRSSKRKVMPLHKQNGRDWIFDLAVTELPFCTWSAPWKLSSCFSLWEYHRAYRDGSSSYRIARCPQLSGAAQLAPVTNADCSDRPCPQVSFKSHEKARQGKRERLNVFLSPAGPWWQWTHAEHMVSTKWRWEVHAGMAHGCCQDEERCFTLRCVSHFHSGQHCSAQSSSKR